MIQIKEVLKEKPYCSWSIDNEPIFDHEGNESAGDDYARIDKLYVPEEKRSKGVGRKLLLILFKKYNRNILICQ